MGILLLFLGLITLFIYYLNIPYKEIRKQKEADLLYTKINQFLHDNENCSPEDFENICIKYIKDNSSSPVILNKKIFNKKSKNKLILYRGFSGESAEKYANEFMSGKIYIGKNVDNVHGNGIYTTSNYECANHFADNNGVIVTMFLNNKEHLLDNKYLEELKDIMVKKHPDEFKYITELEKTDFLYDPMNNLTTEYLFKRVYSRF